MKKIKLFFLGYIFIVFFAVSVTAEKDEKEEIPPGWEEVPPGMEVVDLGTATTVAPEGMEVREVVGCKTLETTDEYLVRRLLDIETRLTELEAKEKELRAEMEELKR